MKTTLLLILLAVLAGSTATGAQGTSRETNQLESLTLDQAFALAERNHPDLIEAKALVEAADGRVRQAGAFPNPEAIARMEQARFNGRTTREAEYLAGIAQPVPLGSRLSKAREAEQLERERRAGELEARRRGLRKRVHGAFATALYQEKAFQTQGEIVSSGQKATAATKARVDAGDAVPGDLARAEMELARAQVELRRSAALREQALATLTAAIGDPALSVKSLGGSLDATFEIPTLETLVANLATQAEMAVALADNRARNAQVDLVKAERIPDVRVEVLYRRLEASKENTFDVGLSIPLPLFDRNQGRLREARAEAAAAEARSRSTENELTLRLREAHAQLTAALGNSHALKTDILPRADTVLKAAEARYAAGDASLDEVLPVRRDWAAVQLTYLESLRDVMQAWANLEPIANAR
jgi:cobalt-zinc-cadmium efflux system outer membrane protein